MLNILKSLTRTVTNMKYDVKNITTKIDRLENVLSDLQKTQNNSSTKNNYYPVDESIYKFPLTNLEELNIFEEKIMDTDFRQKMVIKIQIKINLSTYYMIIIYNTHMQSYDFFLLISLYIIILLQLF